ncbi:MAG TPA: S41 family peptidase [Sneathiellales bacterium]|jgi:carboxyl-terminal processing protease|nr:S41 family peptidase [Sneathiellales bacterium]
MPGIIFALSVALLLALGQPTPASAQGSSETYRQLNLFGDVFERIRADYVEDVSDEELIESAINGMLSSLDPHSGYLSPKNFREMQVRTRGKFGGLGIEVTMERGFVRVISPIDDTPAFRAGIQAGDIITKIDGTQVQGLTLGEAVELMRGPINSDVVLTVARENVEEQFDVTITRDTIKLQSVRFRVESDAAYVRIMSFNEQTIGGLRRALKSLTEELGESMTGVILDLRQNPGGLLDQAIRVSDAFLERGEIVSTRSRRAGDSQRFNAKPGDLANGKPIVILINGGSASASEIVAGALQDHSRAVILGTQSFGKGSVQTIIPLAGQGAIKLTTSLYYTPSGRSIQAQGITPDIFVEQARLELINPNPQRQNEASYRNALGNGNSDESADADEDADVGEDADADVDKDETEVAVAEEQPFDYQLSRAVDLLRGMKLFQKKVVN